MLMQASILAATRDQLDLYGLAQARDYLAEKAGGDAAAALKLLAQKDPNFREARPRLIAAL